MFQLALEQRYTVGMLIMAALLIDAIIANVALL